MPERTKRAKNLISASFFVILGMFLVIGARQFKLWSPSGPGAGFFPLVLGLIMILLSVILFTQTILSGSGEKKSILLQEGAEKKRSTIVRVASYALLMLFYGLLFKWVGFFITTFVFLITTLRYVEKLKWRRTVLVGFGTTILGYFLFKYWLGVPLPMGLMKDLIP